MIQNIQQKRGIHYNFSGCSLAIVFVKNMLEQNLSLKYADEKQIQIADELRDMVKIKYQLKKYLF